MRKRGREAVRKHVMRNVQQRQVEEFSMMTTLLAYKHNRLITRHMEETAHCSDQNIKPQKIKIKMNTNMAHKNHLQNILEAHITIYKVIHINTIEI